MGRMVEVCAEDFADHPVMRVICCGQPMDDFHSEHVREGAGATNRQVHRIGRGCYSCGATVITSLTIRTPEPVTAPATPSRSTP